MINPFPRRGEIWLVDFNPGRGSEQKGFRPAVIVQNDIGNQYAATTIIAAITTTIKIYPVAVFLKALVGGLKNDSMVNCAQILTISKDRLKKKIGSLDKELVKKIDQALRVSLGLLVF
ncbi:PemK family transcriptional regulator [candidate division WOR-3 bacterium RBG_13_43_14]|uniref:mRNA interferase n=1 Tax=candidate division WOR-3 bacterium RBG_13_43_14 TaxID=1802590 RepID=A0A1F4UG38_UNCW3|nr:MAG: PemK family transcriptional regulator [candidate division WOR-3 bacterium RBG_13_43_14]